MRLGAASLAAAAILSGAAGCSSLLGASSAEIAGVGGAALASAVTTDAAVATGIGLGAQAVGRAGLQRLQRHIHRDAQDRIAQVAGGLDVGAVGYWNTEHRLRLEKDEQGRVTVSRIISTTGLQCKEIVFSVDPDEADESTGSAGAGPGAGDAPGSAFYVAAICRDGAHWKWATAEPATERWGALQ